MPLAKTPSGCKSDLYKMDSILRGTRLLIVTYSFKRCLQDTRFRLATRLIPALPKILLGLMLHLIATLAFIYIMDYYGYYVYVPPGYKQGAVQTLFKKM